MLIFCSGVEMKLVLWGNHAVEFDGTTVHSFGQEHTVVGIFVGTLVKSYRGQSWNDIALFLFLYVWMLGKLVPTLVLCRRGDLVW